MDDGERPLMSSRLTPASEKCLTKVSSPRENLTGMSALPARPKSSTFMSVMPRTGAPLTDSTRSPCLTFSLAACVPAGGVPHDGREVGRSDRADHHVEEEGEDEVRGGPRKEHEAALPAGLTGVEPATVLFSEIRIRLVGHPHVAAERQGREAVFSLPLSPSPEHGSHAEGESRHLDVEELGREEMPALVNDDDDADGE